jgi:hypothetical protein
MEEGDRSHAAVRVLSTVSVAQPLEIVPKHAQDLTEDEWGVISGIPALASVVGVTLKCVTEFCRNSQREIAQHCGKVAPRGRPVSPGPPGENPLWHLTRETWSEEHDPSLPELDHNSGPESVREEDTSVLSRDEVRHQAAVLNGAMASLAEKEAEIVSLRSEIESLSSQLRVSDSVLDTVGKCRRNVVSGEDELRVVHEECGQMVHALEAELLWPCWRKRTRRLFRIAATKISADTLRIVGVVENPLDHVGKSHN